MQQEAQDNNTNILSLQFFASHRFNDDGMQSIATKTKEKRSGMYKQIKVEQIIRTCAKDTPNVYYLIMFAYPTYRGHNPSSTTKPEIKQAPLGKIVNFTMVFGNTTSTTVMDERFAKRI